MKKSIRANYFASRDYWIWEAEHGTGNKKDWPEYDKRGLRHLKEGEENVSEN